VEFLHIVCRFKDPEGQKEKDGVRYTGWLRDDFDLYLEKAAPCIKPFNNYTTQYFNVSPEDMKYDLEVTDQEDPLYQSSIIQQYGNYRKSHYGGIRYIGTIVDDFGLRNGFTHVLSFFEKIKQGEFKANVEHLCYVLVFLARTLPFWTREFMCTKMNFFNEAFLGAISTRKSSNPLNQAHTRGHINILTNNYHMLLRRYYVPRKHHRMLNYINSLIGCSLLELENLEKRIFGIKLIADQIASLPYLEQSMRRKEEIAADLKSLNAFKIIFSSKNYH